MLAKVCKVIDGLEDAIWPEYGSGNGNKGPGKRQEGLCMPSWYCAKRGTPPCKVTAYMSPADEWND